MPDQTDMLGQLQEQMRDSLKTVQQATPTRPDGSPIEDPGEIKQYWANLAAQGIDISQFGQSIDDMANTQMDVSKQMINTVAGRNLFNLKSAQMAPEMAAPQPQPGEEDPFAPAVSIDAVQFSSPQDVYDSLSAIGNVRDAIDQFNERFGHDNATLEDPDNPQRKSDMATAIQEPIKDFYQSADEDEKLKIAEFIYHKVIRSSDTQGETVPTNHVDNIQPHVASVVADTNDIVRRLAENDATKKAKPGVFNFRKEAQHKALENVMMYGPEDVVYDNISRQPISKWHLVERNKGFGLKLDSLMGVDFENVWRNNIMDKYTPDYLDERFETDRNVSPINNLRLNPGEKRKPILPEYGNIGSRLESERTKMNKERGYDPSVKGEVFNWKKASKLAEYKDPDNFHPCGDCLLNKPCQCKKKVEAQLKDPAQNDGMKPLKFPGDSTVKSPSMKCQHCGKDIATGANGTVLETVCSCGNSLTSPKMSAPKTGPDPRKSPQQQAIQRQPPSIQPNSRLGSNQQADFSGIFFDGQKFVCYAQKEKHQFDEYEKAEQFMQLPSRDIRQMPMNKQQPPLDQMAGDEVDEVDMPVHPVLPMHPKKKEVATSAHGLAL